MGRNRLTKPHWDRSHLRRGSLLLIVGSIDEDDTAWEPILKLGFETRRVLSCKEALELMDEGRPAVVMCDQHLPDGTWKDLVDAAESLQDPPTLVVTSRIADERLWAEVLNLGAYDLLARPFNRNEVERTVGLAWQHWVNRHGLSGRGHEVRGFKKEVTSMFQSLNEEIERGTGEKPLSGTSLLRYGGFLVASIVAFGALYVGIVLLD
jgi:DNA-binding NtrC family response regulator